MPVRGGSERQQGGRGERATKPKAETQAKAGTTVKKLPLTDKVKKFLDEVDPELNDQVFEMVERVVQGEDGDKNNCCFVIFTDDPKEETVSEEANVEAIKKVLLHYHTRREGQKATSKVLVLSVLPPESDEDTHIAMFQEYSVN